MIRYGGLYARHRKIDSKLHRAISKVNILFIAASISGELLFFPLFGYDPLECPDCKHKMMFLELYYNHKRVSLEELYEKAMSKSRGKRSFLHKSPDFMI